MKTLPILASLFLLSSAAAFAQANTVGAANNSVSSVTPNSTAYVAHDVTGFSNPYTGPERSKGSIERAPDLHPNLKPQPGGMVTDVVKYGPVMLSPTAPASYGIGAKYLSAPDPREDVPDESGQAAHRDSGGIKVFSFEF
jgi:hypothetical protein